MAIMYYHLRGDIYDQRELHAEMTSFTPHGVLEVGPRGFVLTPWANVKDIRGSFEELEIMQ